MKVYVDADACPVVKIAERVAKEKNIPVVLLCDTNHILNSDYSEISVVGAGNDAVDFELVNRCSKGDIVVTQDYGLAAMALGRGAKPIHQSGLVYTDKNIDSLLASRYIVKTAKRASGKNHIGGPKKRTREDDLRFEAALRELIDSAINPQGL